MTFEYRDAYGRVLTVNHDLDDDDNPMAVLWSRGEYGVSVPVRIPADRVEELVAGIRDAARTAAAIDTGSDRAQHACTNCDGIDPASCLTNPGRAARQTTGQTGAWPLATPCGYCSHTRNWHMPKGRCQVKAGETGCGCSAFVAPDGSHPDPTTADDPTPLRWGLGDVLHSDDDTVIVCLSGPNREPYWLELDAERAAALRAGLTTTAGTQTALDRVRAVADEWAKTAQRYPESRVSTETVAFVLRTALAAPAVGQPAGAQPADEARPPRERWTVEGYDADEWNPVSRTFSSSQDAHARKRVSQRYPDMPTRVVRETTTWTVEDER